MGKLKSFAVQAWWLLVALVIVAVVFGVNFVLFIGHPWR
jgi:hypothetical protein